MSNEMQTFRAHIRQTDSGPAIPIQILVSDEVASLPPEQAKDQLNLLVREIQPAQQFKIFRFQTLGEYETPPSKDEMLGHNTLVGVKIPYTLHLPSKVPFTVVCPQVGEGTLVLEKVWTELSQNSHSAEIYADDQPLYYAPSKIIGPHVPQPPELGPWPHFKGTNVEFMKDTQGIFRYTQITVLFDSPSVPAASIERADDATGEGIDSKQEDADEAVTAAISSAVGKAHTIVNYLLDVYRHVTGAEHIERLASIVAERVYFRDANLLSEGISIPMGLGSAVVNRSGREIEQIRAMLGRGIEPPRHALLTQSSHAALGRGQDVLAVVVGFQALEILLEQKLREAYTKQGLDDNQITEKLKINYRTKDRLTVLCREVTGGKSVADDTAFWSSWLNDCNQKRNGVVHRNEGLTHKEAETVLRLCEECTTRLSALPFPS